VQILNIAVEDADEEVCSNFGHNDLIVISFKIKNLSNENGIICSLGLQDFQERKIFTEQIELEHGYTSHKVSLPIGLLRPNSLRLSLALHIPNVKVLELRDSISFEIVDRGSEFSIYGNADNGILFCGLNWISKSI
jgi:hypothetical protein